MKKLFQELFYYFISMEEAKLSIILFHCKYTLSKINRQAHLHFFDGFPVVKEFFYACFSQGVMDHLHNYSVRDGGNMGA